MFKSTILNPFFNSFTPVERSLQFNTKVIGHGLCLHDLQLVFFSNQNIICFECCSHILWHLVYMFEKKSGTQNTTRLDFEQFLYDLGQ
jgi:hypothetical protein